MQVKFSIFFHHGSLNVIGDKFRFVRSKFKSRKIYKLSIFSFSCLRRSVLIEHIANAWGDLLVFGTTHVIHCIITNFACLSGNKFTNGCPSSRRVFKSIKVIFHCSCAVHLERNISFKESIHNCNCGFPWFNLSLLIICCLWQLPLCFGYTRLTSLTLEKIENVLQDNFFL